MAVVSTSQFPPTQACKKLYDYDGSGNLIYEGWAHPGALSSEMAWAIKQYNYSSSNLASELWAFGNTNQQNIWDNRASLTYA